MFVFGGLVVINLMSIHFWGAQKSLVSFWEKTTNERNFNTLSGLRATDLSGKLKLFSVGSLVEGSMVMVNWMIVIQVLIVSNPYP